jgi:hypothetical protein
MHGYFCKNAGIFGDFYADLLSVSSVLWHTSTGYCLTREFYLIICPGSPVGPETDGRQLRGQRLPDVESRTVERPFSDLLRSFHNVHQFRALEQR